MADPRLSVVVCTHNRRPDLERCLRALARVEEPLEIIVVDSGSEPPCRDLVERYRSELATLRYLREELPGLSRARNRGVSEATGEIVAFVDDDAAPKPDWAGHVLAAFDAERRIGCLGGACMPVFEAERPRWLSDRLLQFAGITCFGSCAREARSSAEWPFGANIAFRMSALPSSAPFVESLGRYGETLLSGEEYALVALFCDAGWKVWLEPDAVVEHTVHADRCASRYYWRRLWWAGVSRARSTEAAMGLGLKLVAAAPLRLCLFLVTGDRVHLYRTAETAGFIAERARLVRRPV